jgi:hypothetical protein
MHSELAYKLFSEKLMQHETLTVKTGKGGLSYYKNGVFVCHFNAQPQKQRDDLGFADFRYDSLRPYLDIDATIAAMQQAALPDVHIKRHKLWCSLHFPLSLMEQVATLFLNHILSKVTPT